MSNANLQDTASYVKEFHSFAPDFGIESKVSLVKPIAARCMLPHFEDEQPADDVEDDLSTHATADND